MRQGWTFQKLTAPPKTPFSRWSSHDEAMDQMYRNLKVSEVVAGTSNRSPVSDSKVVHKSLLVFLPARLDWVRGLSVNQVLTSKEAENSAEMAVDNRARQVLRSSCRDTCFISAFKRRGVERPEALSEVCHRGAGNIWELTFF